MTPKQSAQSTQNGKTLRKITALQEHRESHCFSATCKNWEQQWNDTFKRKRFTQKDIRKENLEKNEMGNLSTAQMCEAECDSAADTDY